MSGLVAGLQNQLERFDSASDLQQSQPITFAVGFFFYHFPLKKLKSINKFITQYVTALY